MNPKLKLRGNWYVLAVAIQNMGIVAKVRRKREGSVQAISLLFSFSNTIMLSMYFLSITYKFERVLNINNKSLQLLFNSSVMHSLLNQIQDYYNSMGAIISSIWQEFCFIIHFFQKLQIYESLFEFFLIFLQSYLIK